MQPQSTPWPIKVLGFVLALTAALGLGFVLGLARPRRVQFGQGPSAESLRTDSVEADGTPS
ncbi:hypothetical protein [Microlunatus sp. Y2014]|uniref:hypothetical protein n=1 Tax=Microlunatus sp. Y2014 TaxID=3418488 RepID=UPI003DA71A35